MSEQLEAAEALLATVQAGRARLALLAHRALPFDRALQLEIAYRVGNSPERILLETPRSTRELPPVPRHRRPDGAAPVGETGDVHPPSLPDPVAPDPVAPDPVPPDPVAALADPDEEPTRVGSVAAVLAAAAVAAAMTGAPDPTDEAPLALGAGDDDLDHDSALDESTVHGTASFQLVLDPPSEGITLDDLVHGSLPDAAPPGDTQQTDAWSRHGDGAAPGEEEHEDEDEDDELIIEEPTEDESSETSPTTVTAAPPALQAAIAAGGLPDELDTDVTGLGAGPEPTDDAHEHDDLATTVADSPPELRAALARERLGDGGGSAFVLAQPRSVGPRVGGADSGAAARGPVARVPTHTPVRAIDEPTQVSRPAISLRTGTAEPGALEVIERGSEPARPEPVGAAAIQILGVGKARTITPTLELGSADTAADDAVPSPDDLGDGAGAGFSLGFVEPDEELDSAIPELGAGGAEGAPAASILTPDGMMPSESGRVAEAATDDDDVRRFRAAAAACEQAGDLQGAVLAWGDVLDLRPSDADAHLGRGRSLVELRDYAAAMSDFQRAEDLAPDRALPLFEMGNLFFARMEYSKAIPYFDQAIEMEEGHAMSWCRRGISHHHRKNHTQAVADLQRAAALDPNIPGLRRYVQMAIKAMQKRRR